MEGGGGEREGRKEEEERERGRPFNSYVQCAHLLP